MIISNCNSITLDKSKLYTQLVAACKSGEVSHWVSVLPCSNITAAKAALGRQAQLLNNIFNEISYHSAGQQNNLWRKVRNFLLFRLQILGILVNATITTAVELDNSLKEKISHKIAAKHQTTYLATNFKVDPSIVGGLIIDVNGSINDLSLLNKFNQIVTNNE